ncbi:MAG: succinate dehydrogenase cytochrome b subunit [Bacteroidales bacterium]|nr:succinate dehydrogenase cytochrome b subunit [Bacteroidales bacterium]MDT8373331.1 succinate dehydrogenase cytochrome b subunit [Bacteroidales bacterium]
MNKTLFSAVSKKFVMALAGLFLLLFLPVHLGINLMLLKSDPEPFNSAAHFMATFPLIKVVELLLFLTILIHITYGIILQILNWLSRPVGYKVRNKSETSAFSRFMIWTGGSVLIFLVIHFFNFYFIKLGLVDGNPEDFYSVAWQLFSVPGYVILYWICFLLLGFHLYHALQSAFQTLGLSNEFWKPVIRAISLIYAVAVPVGFAIIPLVIWLFK